MTDLGKVGMVMKGDYNSASTYEVLDVVGSQFGLYVAKQNVPVNTPPPNSTYWQEALKLRGMVSVNADGVKTYAELLTELKNLINTSDLTPNSVLGIKKWDGSNNEYEFSLVIKDNYTGYANMGISGNKIQLTRIILELPQLISVNSDGTSEDLTNTVPASGIVIKIYY